MAGKESTKSTEEGPPAPRERGFYGLAEHPNHGIISSILKRKSRKFTMTNDAKHACKSVEAYKSCCDRLHQSILFMLVENPQTSKDLINVVKTEPGYRYAGQYLKTYEAMEKLGRKGTYDSLEPAIKALLNLDAEHEKRVKKQIDNLKPLTKFIAEEYWEYARLRRVYWESLESYDDAVTQQNKERTEQAEQATANAQNWRNDCRQKMLDFIQKSINEQKGKHAECVLKFRDEAILYHRAMAELIPAIDVKPEKEKSAIKAPTSK